jgi:hypothetical protein
MLRLRATVLVFSLAAGAEAALPSDPAGCTAPEHRQFDFWLGAWEVTSSGKPAGANRIESDLKGCLLVEQWTAQSGGRGTSLNFYDRVTRAWYQTWMDEQGGALRLKGGLVDGRMVMQSEPLPDEKGVPTVQRITWSRQGNGSVRQHWEASSDGGRTWSTVFDGHYVKKR